MKLAIFDFEGTLVDFQWQLKAALAAVHPRLEEVIIRENLDRKFIAAADYCRLYNYLQAAIADAGRRAAAIAVVDEVFDRFDADAASRWQLYPEVHETLTFLKDNGWELALASNVGRRALEQMFARFSLAPYFACTITRNDVALLKPAPEGIEKILAFYRCRDLRPTVAVLIGDSVTDIETARNAGIRVAVRTNGEDRTTRLKAHSPDLLVNSLEELPDFLPRL